MEMISSSRPNVGMLAQALRLGGGGGGRMRPASSPLPTGVARSTSLADRSIAQTREAELEAEVVGLREKLAKARELIKDHTANPERLEGIPVEQAANNKQLRQQPKAA